MDRNLQVFPSEKRLYGTDKKVNHRLHPAYEPIEEVIFSNEETNKYLLHSLLASGASRMCGGTNDLVPNLTLVTCIGLIDSFLCS